MRRVLERLGFVEEGVLRAFMPSADQGREDYVMYAVTEPAWRDSFLHRVPENAITLARAVEWLGDDVG